MNCKIVGAICQHNFAPTQTVLVSFQRKEARYFEKTKKIVTWTNYFMRSCPCFHLILNKIPLNKTKNASDVWPRWNSRQMSTSSKWRAEKSLDTTAKYSKHSVENNTSVTTPNNTFEITNLTSAQNHFTWHRHWKFGRCFKWSVRFEFKIIQKLFLPANTAASHSTFFD